MEGCDGLCPRASPGEKTAPASAAPHRPRKTRRVVPFTRRQCSREPASTNAIPQQTQREWWSEILSTFDHGMLLVATLLLSAGIDRFCRMMAITTVVGGGLAVANDPVPRAQGGFRFRDCGRRRRRGRGGRGRIVCAAKKHETRHADQDSFPCGSDSIHRVSGFSKPPRDGQTDVDNRGEIRFIRSHFERKIALGLPLADPSRRLRIHLHFSLTVSSISLILPAGYRFSRHQNQPVKEEGSGSLPRCA